MRPVTFAYPGDLSALTGGYGYDRRLVAALRALGHPVSLLHLGDGFPEPAAEEVREAAARLASVPESHALVVDGLAFGAMPAATLSRVAAPMVALVHHPLALETGIDPERATRVAATERAALATAAAVVVTSPTTRETLLADYGVAAADVTVALPGLDPAWRQAPERRATEPPLVVSVGSVIPRKGFDVLVAALSRLADLPWRLAIAGSLDRAPATAAALRHAVAAARLEARVTLLGEIPEEAIRGLYRTASVFCLPSRYEGFGMVFAEAMAAGLPVVATRGGAITEVVPPEAGILVEVDDVAALADALRRVLSDGACANALSAGAEAASRRFHGWDETGRIVSRRIGELETRA